METLILATIRIVRTNIAAERPRPNTVTVEQSWKGARGFYNVTLKNWIAPWTNEEQTVFTDLNDYTATAIGMIRDGA